jgi:hypothetical protein
MTYTDLAALMGALAALVTALAQLVAVLRSPP